MNESSTRAELIDPQLKHSGWGVVEHSKILREYHITKGRIQAGGRAKAMIVDYVLVYRGRKLAVVEAKSDECDVSEGVHQAKEYAQKLQIKNTYSANGKNIYHICLQTGREESVSHFPTPQELWQKTFSGENQWRDKFDETPFEDLGGTKSPYYYQEIAVNNVLNAIAQNKQRILLTLATGTGKTFIAFQIAWKLFQTRWNLKRDGSRRPRILFLADRNVLADQGFNSFSAFSEDALVRINPKEINKNGKVPTNGSISFTIFQTFMSGKNKEPHFGQYPKDYFDCVIIDECHRGGANNESTWRNILEYFSPAVQLGLTATPKRRDNVDTYDYFGEPVYIYSLKDGINDGFLTPFKVRRIQSSLDKYVYTSDDEIIEGEIESGKIYTESDFNRIIEIKERESSRVKKFMDEINQNEKTIVFCATQDHAAAVRDLINQYKKSKDPNYCVRVTANDGELGEQYLREFQDNEKTIPTILTTSQKLSTGVDARNVRNIVLMRPVNSMIEFKQIVGRGTRIFDGKEYFTIYDFVDAYMHFSDPEWDGEPLNPETEKRERFVVENNIELVHSENSDSERRQKVKIKLRDGKEREIQHIASTLYWEADGKPISASDMLKNLFGKLPDFFKSEEELREIWSDPKTRSGLLSALSDAGFDKGKLQIMQRIIDAEKSDLFDVLEYVAFAVSPITREKRVLQSQTVLFYGLNNHQKEFIEFVLSQYIETGVEELAQEKLPALLQLKYQAINDATEILGDISQIKNMFVNFQKYLYEQRL